jgi:uncharacterized membrane protein required for colicin V production
MTWPDLVILGIAVVFAVKGFQKGFVSELAGSVAMFIAVIAAFRYPGTWDATAKSMTGLGPGSAHVVGMVAFAVMWYAIVMLISFGLGKIARLPVIGIVNSAAGALVGAGKALVGAWAVLYVILFFPLSPDLHNDLHKSAVVQLVTQPNAGVDEAFRGLMPWFVKPFVGPFFAHHKA